MSTFKVVPGSLVMVNGERHIIIKPLSIEEVQCRRLSNEELLSVLISDLRPAPKQDLLTKGKANTVDLASVSGEAWNKASAFADVIRALHEKGRYQRTLDDIRAASEATGKSQKTIYRWLKKFEIDKTVTAFLPKERSDKGSTRLTEEAEELIVLALKSVLRREAASLPAAHTILEMECKLKGIAPPSLGTLKNRYKAIPEKERVAKRQGSKAAKEKFTPLRGSFPGADHPLAVIQIDHTPVDLIIVDEVYRKPIGRPTLTIAVDIYSRALMGFNLWLEAPGAAAVALCISHAMLPKDKWLAERGLNASWPCFGRPRKIHTDNAKEFRGTALGRACDNYGIDLEQRPRGAANFGGHVERGFRTYMSKTHTLQGTTFSNTKKKVDYDSSGKAILTLKEFEAWFTTYVAKIYHNDFHDGIETTPLARFQQGLLGSDDEPGIGLPELFVDEKKVLLDFMPFIERSVQEYGVLWDRLYYYDDVLRTRIHEKDPKNPKEARKFIFRRDPSDVSVLYFWDPDLENYREIPFANRSLPPASLWEVKAARKAQIARGKSMINETVIFEGISEMREIEAAAAAKTKGARRNEQRRKDAEKRTKKKEVNRSPASVQLPPEPIQERLVDDDDPIEAFDDIDTRS